MTNKLQWTVLIAGVVALSACGGGPVDFLDSGHPKTHEDEVISAEEQPRAPQAGSPVNGDETIQPTAPATPVPSYDAPAALPENPAPAAEPAAFSLKIAAEKKFDTRLGLVRLTWNATGPIDELSLWSEGFNRLPGDKNSDDPCGGIDDASSDVTRQPLVNSIDGPNLGFDLNDGSPAHTALLPYLDSAQLCDEGLCEGFSESAATPPACRIDLNPSQPVGVFYTRTLAKDAVYHLCAHTAEGTTCTASSPVSAPHVSIGDVSATTTSDEKIRFTVDYANAVREATAPHGCVKVDGGSYNDRNHGQGTLIADCPITSMADTRLKHAPALVFRVDGIGSGNIESRSYRVQRKPTPVIALKAAGDVKCDDPYKIPDHCEGRINLVADAYREFGLYEFAPGEVDRQILLGRTAEGLSVGLSSNQGSADYVSTEKKSATETKFNGVRRSHAQYEWRATVQAQGKTYNGPWLQEPRFPTQFELGGKTQTLHPSDWDGCDHENVNDGEAECGVCIETSGYYEASVGWRGRHLKRITADCTSSSAGLVASGRSIEIPDGYEAQGDLLGSPAIAFQVPVSGSGWTDTLTCTLTGEGYDDTKIVRTQTWTPNCAITHAQKGDSFDPDLEGAFIELGSGWSNSLDLWTLVSSQWDGE